MSSTKSSFAAKSASSGAVQQHDPRRLSTAVLGIVLMWLSVTQLGIPWTLGSTVLLLISVAGTVLMLLGLFLVEASAVAFCPCSPSRR